MFSILGIIRPLKKYIHDQFEKSLPSDIIVVQNKQTQAPNFLGSLFQKEKDLPIGVPATKIKTFYTWEEIEAIYRSQVLQRSALASFDHPLLSRLGISFDLLIQGVHRELVSERLDCMKNFTPVKTKTPEGGTVVEVPLVLPESFSEIAYAYSLINNLPPVQPKDIIGLRINIQFGRSITRTNPGFSPSSTQYIGIVCGFVKSDLVSVAGAPIYWVREMHLAKKQVIASDHYDRVFLKIKNIKDREVINERLVKMGLQPEVKKKEFDKIYTFFSYLDLLLWGFVAVLVVITGVSLSNSALILATQKKYEFGLYLVFGASPFFLWGLIFLDGAFWGALHSIGAYLAAEGLSESLQSFIFSSGWLPVKDEKAVILQYTISSLEKTYLIGGAILFSGISSMLPVIFMTGKKTLSLIKKD